MSDTPRTSSKNTEFKQGQFESLYPDGVRDHYWTKARHKIVTRKLAAAFSSLQSDEIVLDVGCGRGLAVEYFRALGVNAVGCDLAQAEPIAKAMEPFLTFGVYAQQLNDELRKKVAVITLMDVLEHMENPCEFLKEVKESFPACRTVLLTLPARQELWSNYDEFNHHYLRYDRSSALRFNMKGCFRITRMGYFFHCLYWPALAIVKSGLKRSTEFNAPTSANRWIHALLASALSAEELILPSGLAGSSLYVMLERD